MCCKYTQLLNVETVSLCLDFGPHFDIRSSNTSRCVDIPLSVLSLLCIPRVLASISFPLCLFLSLFLSLPLFLFLSSEHEIYYHLSNRATQNIMSKQAQTDANTLIQKQTVITVDRGKMHWRNAPVCVCVCVLTVECAVNHHNQFVLQCINCMLILDKMNIVSCKSWLMWIV